MIRETLPGMLKMLTVYLIIWAGSELALVHAFSQGISTLFAAIIGYVFGSYRMSPGGKPKGGGPPVGFAGSNLVSSFSLKLGLTPRHNQAIGIILAREPKQGRNQYRHEHARS